MEKPCLLFTKSPSSGLSPAKASSTLWIEVLLKAIQFQPGTTLMVRSVSSGREPVMVSGTADVMSILYISRTLRLVRVPSQIPSYVMEEAVLLFIRTLSPVTPLITAPTLMSSAFTAREVQFQPVPKAMVCSILSRALSLTGALNEP